MRSSLLHGAEVSWPRTLERFFHKNEETRARTSVSGNLRHFSSEQEIWSHNAFRVGQDWALALVTRAANFLCCGKRTMAVQLF